MTNEQRAHDLTIASIPILKNDRSYIETQNLPSENGFDPYKAYKDIYFMALDLFNRDFPEG